MRRFAALLLICALNASPLTLAADEPSFSGVCSPVQPDRARLGKQICATYPIRLIRRVHEADECAAPSRGSPYDKDNAEWILARFKEWGLDAHIETFNVLFPTPKVRLLEMTEPTKFTAKLEEPALAVDPTSNQKAEHFPPTTRIRPMATSPHPWCL